MLTINDFKGFFHSTEVFNRACKVIKEDRLGQLIHPDHLSEENKKAYEQMSKEEGLQRVRNVNSLLVHYVEAEPFYEKVAAKLKEKDIQYPRDYIVKVRFDCSVGDPKRLFANLSIAHQDYLKQGKSLKDLLEELCGEETAELLERSF